MLFGCCRFTRLAADDLAYELNTLALVRFGLAERADLGADLAKELLVG